MIKSAMKGAVGTVRVCNFITIQTMMELHYDIYLIIISMMINFTTMRKNFIDNKKKTFSYLREVFMMSEGLVTINSRQIFIFFPQVVYVVLCCFAILRI